MKFEGDAVSLCGLRHQAVQCVGVAQVGQEQLAVSRSAWATAATSGVALYESKEIAADGGG